jgi:MFS family permease
MDPLSDQEHDSFYWPPGTVRIEDIHKPKGEDIILLPVPTTDPNDPLNWPKWEKWWNFALTNYYAMLVFAFIDVVTPTWGPMNEQLGFSWEMLNDSYAIGCGTLAIGAFLLIPFALKYGRRPIYILSTIVQFGIAIWSAKQQTVADLLLVNALSCGVGALSEVIVQMTIADVFFVHQRGLMNAIYIWTSSIGGTLAPVAAGYITDNQGWRWVWWWCTILFGVGFVVYLFAYEETKYTPKIHAIESSDTQSTDAEHSVTADPNSKSAYLSESTKTPAGEHDPHVTQERNPSVIAIDPTIPRKTYRQRLAFANTTPGPFKKFYRHSWQPVVILFTFPAVAYMSLVYAVMNAWQTVTITTLSTYMYDPPWGFTSSQIGLMSVPPWIGTTIGALMIGPVTDWSILYLARRNKGIYEPEMRLWAMVPFVLFVPFGALLFGIGLDRGLPWPALAMGSAISQFGTAPISTVALTYITDSYTDVCLPFSLSLRLLVKHPY